MAGGKPDRLDAMSLQTYENNSPSDLVLDPLTDYGGHTPARHNEMSGCLAIIRLRMKQLSIIHQHSVLPFLNTASEQGRHGSAQGITKTPCRVSDCTGATICPASSHVCGEKWSAQLACPTTAELLCDKRSRSALHSEHLLDSRRRMRS